MQRLIILICIQIAYSSHNVQTNRSDIIITYAGHVDAMEPAHPVTDTPKTNETTDVTENVTEVIKEVKTTTKEETTFEYPADEDEVIFVPNDKDVHRIEDVENEFYNQHMNIGDVMSKTAVGDLIKKATTEPPNADILFISGKNAEPIEKHEPVKGSEMHMDTRRSGSEKKIKKKKKLDCTHLSCQNKLQSVCGGKMERNEWKYRLFLNECFFRKVNCNFNYEENRYIEVPKERCSNVGQHLSVRPKIMQAPSEPLPPKENLNMRRSFSSRRAMNQDINGRFCSHPCPDSCPDEYDPECAVSKNSERKVFVNHCKLDWNSCFYGEVWQLRPLSVCVGGKKADMRQNRGFIAWMQRVGMVNNKGKLMV